MQLAPSVSSVLTAGAGPGQNSSVRTTIVLGAPQLVRTTSLPLRFYSTPNAIRFMRDRLGVSAYVSMNHSAENVAKNVTANDLFGLAELEYAMGKEAGATLGAHVEYGVDQRVEFRARTRNLTASIGGKVSKDGAQSLTSSTTMALHRMAATDADLTAGLAVESTAAGLGMVPSGVGRVALLARAHRGSATADFVVDLDPRDLKPSQATVKSSSQFANTTIGDVILGTQMLWTNSGSVGGAMDIMFGNSTTSSFRVSMSEQLLPRFTYTKFYGSGLNLLTSYQTSLRDPSQGGKVVFSLQLS